MPGPVLAPTGAPSFYDALRNLAQRLQLLGPGAIETDPQAIPPGGIRGALGSAAEWLGEQAPDFLAGAAWGDPMSPGTTANTLGQLAMVGLPIGMAAGRAAVKSTTEAARLARARALGFDLERPVYHGTQARWSWMDDPEKMAAFQRGEDITGVTSDAVKELRPSSGGLKLMDGLGVHVGTAEAAGQRLRSNVGAGPWTRQSVDPKLTRAYILPLYMRSERPFVKADGSYFTESQLQGRLAAIAARLGHTTVRRYSARSGGDASLRQTQRAVRQYLQDQGYDSIPYINSHEDRGSVSWILFDPAQLRSQFAAFDPAEKNSRDLLASLAALLAGGGAAATTAQGPPPTEGY